MNRRKINRISAIAPVVMSAAALSMLAFQAATGWFKGGPDEGAPAHIFQLLIVLQIPFILVFLATADWRRTAEVAPPVVLQAGGLLLALGSVMFFRL